MTVALVPEATGIAEAVTGAAAAKAAGKSTGSKSVRAARKEITGRPPRRTASERTGDLARSTARDVGSSHLEAQTRKLRAGGRGGRARRASPSASGAIQHSGALIVEWILAVVLILITVPLEKQQQGYTVTISTMMLRLTGLTGIFFFLALLGTSPTTHRFAVWFGLIIDLGIIYHAATSGSGQLISNIFNHTSTLNSSTGSVKLAADYTTGSPQNTAIPGDLLQSASQSSPTSQSGGISA